MAVRIGVRRLVFIRSKATPLTRHGFLTIAQFARDDHTPVFDKREPDTILRIKG
jgi:hypothetical protein